MYEKRRTHKNIIWFKHWNSLIKVVYEVVLSHLKAVLLQSCSQFSLLKKQMHHKYRPRKFLNLNITILMAPLIPSVVIPPGICRASCRSRRREICQKTSSRRGVGLLSILLEAVNVVPFFQYFTVTSKLAEKKLNFFSVLPWGFCMNRPALPWGFCSHLRKKWQMPDKCPGVWARLELTEPLKALLSAMPTD